MGILNATPDSFSDGGRFVRPDEALQHAEDMVAAGADIVDVGAESTRPGATPVSAEEELRRLEAVLPRLVAELPVPVSVDTQKARVAEYALSVGAHIINDVWGLQGDPDMAATVAKSGCGLVLMHNRRNADYPEGLMPAVRGFLAESVRRAEAYGIERQRLVLDPGIGFGKEPWQSYQVTARLAELKDLGLPILYGPSRKRFLGWATGRPVAERLHATVAVVALAALLGADIVRVHDIGPAIDGLRVAERLREALPGVAETTVGVRDLMLADGMAQVTVEVSSPGSALESGLTADGLQSLVEDVLANHTSRAIEAVTEDVLEAVRSALPLARAVRVEVRAGGAARRTGVFVRSEWQR